MSIVKKVALSNVCPKRIILVYSGSTRYDEEGMAMVSIGVTVGDSFTIVIAV